MATARNEDLKVLAQRVADALPTSDVDEVVLTGSVSRGVADEVADIEMLSSCPSRSSLTTASCLLRRRGSRSWTHGAFKSVQRDGSPVAVSGCPSS
jgi:hypothetical protein